MFNVVMEIVYCNYRSRSASLCAVFTGKMSSPDCNSASGPRQTCTLLTQTISEDRGRDEPRGSTESCTTDTEEWKSKETQVYKDYVRRHSVGGQFLLGTDTTSLYTFSKSQTLFVKNFLANIAKIVNSPLVITGLCCLYESGSCRFLTMDYHGGVRIHNQEFIRNGYLTITARMRCMMNESNASYLERVLRAQNVVMSNPRRIQRVGSPVNKRTESRDVRLPTMLCSSSKDQLTIPGGTTPIKNSYEPPPPFNREYRATTSDVKRIGLISDESQEWRTQTSRSKRATVEDTLQTDKAPSPSVSFLSSVLKKSTSLTDVSNVVARSIKRRQKQRSDLVLDEHNSPTDVGSIDGYLHHYKMSKKSIPAAVIIQRWWKMAKDRKKFNAYMNLRNSIRQSMVFVYFATWASHSIAISHHQRTIVRKCLRAWKNVSKGRDGSYQQKLFTLPMKHEKLTLQLTSLHAFREVSRDRAAPSDKLVNAFRHMQLEKVYKKMFYVWYHYSRERRKRSEVLKSLVSKLARTLMTGRMQTMLIMWYRMTHVKKILKTSTNYPTFPKGLTIWDKWYSAYKKKVALRDHANQRWEEKKVAQSLKAWRVYIQIVHAKKAKEQKADRYLIALQCGRFLQSNITKLWKQYVKNQLEDKAEALRIFTAWKRWSQLRASMRTNFALIHMRRTRLKQKTVFRVWRKYHQYRMLITSAGLANLRMHISLAYQVGFAIAGPKTQFVFMSCWHQWTQRAKKRILMKRFLLVQKQLYHRRLLGVCFTALRYHKEDLILDIRSVTPTVDELLESYNRIQSGALRPDDQTDAGTKAHHIPLRRKSAEGKPRAMMRNKSLDGGNEITVDSAYANHFSGEITRYAQTPSKAEMPVYQQRCYVLRNTREEWMSGTDPFMWVVTAGHLWDTKMKKMIEMKQTLRGVDMTIRRLNKAKTFVTTFGINSVSVLRNFYRDLRADMEDAKDVFQWKSNRDTYLLVVDVAIEAAKALNRIRPSFTIELERENVEREGFPPFEDEGKYAAIGPPKLRTRNSVLDDLPYINLKPVDFLSEVIDDSVPSYEGGEKVALSYQYDPSFSGDGTLFDLIKNLIFANKQLSHPESKTPEAVEERQGELERLIAIEDQRNAEERERQRKEEEESKSKREKSIQFREEEALVYKQARNPFFSGGYLQSTETSANKRSFSSILVEEVTASAAVEAVVKKKKENATAMREELKTMMAEKLAQEAVVEETLKTKVEQERNQRDEEKKKREADKEHDRMNIVMANRRARSNSRVGHKEKDTHGEQKRPETRDRHNTGKSEKSRPVIMKRPSIVHDVDHKQPQSSNHIQQSTSAHLQQSTTHSTHKSTSIQPHPSNISQAQHSNQPHPSEPREQPKEQKHTQHEKTQITEDKTKKRDVQKEKEQKIKRQRSQEELAARARSILDEITDKQHRTTLEGPQKVKLGATLFPKKKEEEESQATMVIGKSALPSWTEPEMTHRHKDLPPPQVREEDASESTPPTLPELLQVTPVEIATSVPIPSEPRKEEKRVRIDEPERWEMRAEDESVEEDTMEGEERTEAEKNLPTKSLQETSGRRGRSRVPGAMGNPLEDRVFTQNRNATLSSWQLGAQNASVQFEAKEWKNTFPSISDPVKKEDVTDKEKMREKEGREKEKHREIQWDMAANIEYIYERGMKGEKKKLGISRATSSAGSREHMRSSTPSGQYSMYPPLPDRPRTGTNQSILEALDFNLSTVNLSNIPQPIPSWYLAAPMTYHGSETMSPTVPEWGMDCPLHLAHLSLEFTSTQMGCMRDKVPRKSCRMIAYF
ncbi:trichohyalin [Planoprotostelium fungivorum]|uniref:Trichohyalin n=1 Tax=Planoprotostelium fungivorum TaxID=1890364 RepID=A0A2P6NBR8_9EUKA|nr:trichohyalin [Planoprotostelium fungivorum]